jgi:hypothetical protein
MFHVVDRTTREEFVVYAVHHLVDKGDTLFLLFLGGEWSWFYSKFYEPVPQENK